MESILQKVLTDKKIRTAEQLHIAALQQAAFDPWSPES